ncbi:hypothetical protein SASPL_141786 [Salvia splendens]|uniref:NAC domain-containing protein n=1 Tax=Salvia splendens TaxID=180675 RepID=A0A8X8WIM0_SALSN|nr:uncharacterized protein LOC121771037 isoform X2 [Salvia splendens]KAG6395663.1 hypothetical protein SASPL_141786 [Salvia splendens]
MGDNLEIRIEQGFALNPTPEKLIKGYLIPWVTGQNPTWNGVVEKDIYGDSSPWEIFSDIESLYHSKMEEKGAIKYTIFAFTTLVRARNSKRVSRKAGKGTWDGQTGPMKIEDSNTGFIIGQSKMFTFGNSGEADVGHWIMHEYSLSKELVMKSGRANAANLVVCKITKTVEKKGESLHNTNQGFFNGDYQVQCAQPELYDDGSNYERFAPATSEGFSSEYIGNNGDYQVQAAQPESYDDGSDYAIFVPNINESPAGIGYRDRYDAPAAQPEPNVDGSNHMRLAPDTTESPAAIGYNDRNDAMAAQPKSNGESCNLVRFAPETNEGFFNGDYQVQCAQPESYGDGSNYERFTPDTNVGFSSEYIGNTADHLVQAAQPESYGDGSYYARCAPDTNEGFPLENRRNDGGYQASAAQLESYGNTSSYMRLAPDTNEGFLPANIGHDGRLPALPESYGDNSIYATNVPNTNEFLLPAYDVPIVQPGVVSTVQQSGAPLQPDAYKLTFPANEVQFANPGIVSISEPYYGGYEVPVFQPEMSYPRISDGSLSSIVQPYCGGYEAPVPVLASPMKRAAEVDLLRNGQDLKRQKCDGYEAGEPTPLSFDGLDFDFNLHPGPAI